MELKIFTPEYANDLAYKVEENLSMYKAGCFNLPKGVEVPSNIVVPDDLLEKMLPYAVSGAQEEYNAAIALYEAFKDLTPLQASYKPFWLHLSHVELMDYMVARWPAVKDDNITEEIASNSRLSTAVTIGGSSSRLSNERTCAVNDQRGT